MAALDGVKVTMGGPEEAAEGDEYDTADSAAQDAFDAIKSGDTKAFAAAIRIICGVGE